MSRQLALYLSVTLVTVEAGRPQAVIFPLLSLLPVVQFAAPVVQQVNRVIDGFALFCDVARICSNSLAFGLNLGGIRL